MLDLLVYLMFRFNPPEPSKSLLPRVHPVGGIRAIPGNWFVLPRSDRPSR